MRMISILTSCIAPDVSGLLRARGMNFRYVLDDDVATWRCPQSLCDASSRVWFRFRFDWSLYGISCFIGAVFLTVAAFNFKRTPRAR